MTDRKDSRRDARRTTRPHARPSPEGNAAAERTPAPVAVDAPRRARRAAAEKRDGQPSSGERATPKPNRRNAASPEASEGKMDAATKVSPAASSRQAAAPAAGESRRSRRLARATQVGGPAEPPVARARVARRQANTEAAEAFQDATRPAAKGKGGAGEDLFMDAPKRRGTPKKRREAPEADPFMNPPKAKTSAARRAVCAALSLLFLGGMAYIGWLVHQQQIAYAQFLEMKRVVENQTFYQGTTVEGMDVSGMTLRAALDYWGKKVEPRYSGRVVTLDDGTTLTAAELGYVSDYQSVLTNAWSAGRRGSLESRYRAAVSHRQNPVAYRVTRVLYDEGLISAFVDAQAEQIDQPAKDAALKGFNMKKLTFAFTDAQKGRKLNAAALKRGIAEALQAGGGSVAREIETLEPKVTAKALKKQYGRVTTATTNASSSSANRLSNIRLALKIINGTCLEPGETFSFNKTVGKRTEERGFKIATAYSGGDVTEEVGGGICQVSTTLFNAAVKADMKIVERHNHSLTVAYVDSGKDATVNWGSQDLRFKNTSGDKVYIVCYLSDDKRVRVGIFGKLLPNGETVTVEAETTELIDFDTDYQPTDELEKGKQEVISNGKQGCKAVAYKVRWDAKGREISREVLCKSWYRAKNQVVAVGT